MGNYCSLTKKKQESPHIYHYSPSFHKISPKHNKKKSTPQSKLKCKKCNHCNQNFFKYSPQIFCSNECRLMKKENFLTEE